MTSLAQPVLPGAFNMIKYIIERSGVVSYCIVLIIATKLDAQSLILLL